MTIEEGNSIIAEFMDVEFINDVYGNIQHVMHGPFTLNRLKYHLSFDWLIPVVEKIEAIHDEFHGYFGVSIYSNSCTIQGTKLDLKNKHYAYFHQSVCDTKIHSVWEEVIFFIMFYNNELKK